MIIGISGTTGSGKDTIADYLKKIGFSYYSCSDILRDECKKRGIESHRDNLIKIGNELRKSYGNGALGLRILKKIRDEKAENAVVVSIRHPDEVKELKIDPKFKLIFVDAHIMTRYKRIKHRKGRPEDDVNFEKFAEQDQKERYGTGASQQLENVRKLADFTIMNDDTLEEFEQRFMGVLEDAGVKVKK